MKHLSMIQLRTDTVALLMRSLLLQKRCAQKSLSEQVLFASTQCVSCEEMMEDSKNECPPNFSPKYYSPVL